MFSIWKQQPATRFNSSVFVSQNPVANSFWEANAPKVAIGGGLGNLVSAQEINPVFERESPAYNPTLVGNHIPRFHNILGRTAILLERGTHNLLSPPQANASGEYANESPAQANMFYDTSFGYNDNTSVRFEQLTSAPASRANSFQGSGVTMIVTPGRFFTVSGRVFPLSANEQYILWIVLRTHITAHFGNRQSGAFTAPANEWSLVSNTTLIPGVVDSANIMLSTTSTHDPGQTWWWDALQFEEGGQPTSWVPGRTTRAPEIFKIPSRIFNSNEGTVEFWTHNLRNDLGNWFSIAGIDANNELRLIGTPVTETTLNVRLRMGLFETSNILVNLDTWNYVAIRWTPSQLILTIGGTTVSIPRSGSVTFGQWAYLGSYLGTGQSVMSCSQFRVSNLARTDQEISNSRTHPTGLLLVDNSTSYLLDFDNNLTVRGLLGQGQKVSRVAVTRTFTIVAIGGGERIVTAAPEGGSVTTVLIPVQSAGQKHARAPPAVSTVNIQALGSGRKEISWSATSVSRFVSSVINTPILTRDSIGYLWGKRFERNIPRIGNNGVLIQRGTRNLFSEAFSRGQVLTATQVGGFSLVVDNTFGCSDSSSLRVTNVTPNTNAGADNHNVTPRVSVTPGVTYTLLGKGFTPHANRRLQCMIQWRTSSGTWLGNLIGSFITLVPNQWGEIFVSGVAPANAGSMSMIIFSNSAWTTGETIWFDDFSVVEGTNVTEWQPGGIIREPEVFKFPAQNINPNEGSIEFWHWGISNDLGNWFSVEGNGLHNQLSVIGTPVTSTSVRLRARIGTGASFVETADITVDPHGWRYVSIRWTSTELRFGIGSSFVSVARTGTGAFGQWAYIGSHLGTGQHSSFVDFFRVSNRWRTDAEVNETRTRPDGTIPVDIWSSYYLTFNSESPVVGGMAAHGNKISRTAANSILNFLNFVNGSKTVFRNSNSILNILLSLSSSKMTTGSGQIEHKISSLITALKGAVGGEEAVSQLITSLMAVKSAMSEMSSEFNVSTITSALKQVSVGSVRNLNLNLFALAIKSVSFATLSNILLTLNIQSGKLQNSALNFGLLSSLENDPIFMRDSFSYLNAVRSERNVPLYTSLVDGIILGKGYLNLLNEDLSRHTVSSNAFAGASSVATLDSTFGRSDSSSTKLTITVTNTTSGVRTPPLNNGVTIVPGRTYTAQGSVFVTRAGLSYVALITWRTAAGTAISSSPQVSWLTATPNRWTTINCEGVAPANAATASVGIVTGHTTVPGDVMWFDDYQITESRVASFWHPGQQPRSPDILMFPTSPLNVEQGTVEFYYVSGWHDTGNWFSVQDNSGNDAISIQGTPVNSTTVNVRARIRTPGGLVQTPDIVFTTTMPTLVTLRWSPTEFSFSVGSTIRTVSKSGNPTFGRWAYFGSFLGSGQVETRLEAIRFSNVFKSDQEILNIISGVNNVNALENVTTYLVRFTNRMVVHGNLSRGKKLGLANLLRVLMIQSQMVGERILGIINGGSFATVFVSKDFKGQKQARAPPVNIGLTLTLINQGRKVSYQNSFSLLKFISFSFGQKIVQKGNISQLNYIILSGSVKVLGDGNVSKIILTSLLEGLKIVVQGTTLKRLLLFSITLGEALKWDKLTITLYLENSLIGQKEILIGVSTERYYVLTEEIFTFNEEHSIFFVVYEESFAIDREIIMYFVEKEEVFFVCN